MRRMIGSFTIVRYCGDSSGGGRKESKQQWFLGFRALLKIVDELRNVSATETHTGNKEEEEEEEEEEEVNDNI